MVRAVAVLFLTNDRLPNEALIINTYGTAQLHIAVDTSSAGIAARGSSATLPAEPSSRSSSSPPPTYTTLERRESGGTGTSTAPRDALASPTLAERRILAPPAADAPRTRAI